MNLLSRIRTCDTCRIPVTLLVLVLLIVPPGLVPAQAPAWWQPRGVVVPGAAADDFAVINQGQVKNFARAAYEEFLTKIPAALGGPGLQLRALIGQWVQIDPATGAVLKDGMGKPLPAIRPPGALAPDDFAAVNVGQIKSVAAPFYERLADIYWSYNSGTPATSTPDPAWIKPWTDALNDDDNYAMANIGQLKRAFALDLDSDADADGLSNLAELLANKNRGLTAEFWTSLANGDSDGDGILDGQDPSPVLIRPATPVNFHVAVPSQEAQPPAAGDPVPVDWTTVELRWDSPVTVPTGYRIERREDSGAWHVLSVVLGPATALGDNGLVANRIYQYRATAFSSASGRTLESEPAYAEDYVVPFILRGFVKRSQISRGKAGFEEYYPPSTPPKYYLTETQTSTLLETSSDPFYAAYETNSGSFSFTKTITPSEHRSTTVGTYTYSETETVGSIYSRNVIETASVNSLEQHRRRNDPKAVFTSDTDYDSSYYDSGSPNLGEIPESGTTYRASRYEYNDTFDPIYGPPVWLGNHFDLEDDPYVTYIKMGESSESDHSSHSSGTFFNSEAEATLAEGVWAGTRTVSSDGSPPETEILTDPPYTEGWNIYGWFGGTITQTSTQRVYSYDSPYNDSTYNYHTMGVEELSQEYTTEAFMADTIADMPDYPAEGSELSGAIAGRDLDESEDHFLITKGKYHFKLDVPSAPKTLVWTEYFVPYDDPSTTAIDESAQSEVRGIRSWKVGSNPTESPEYEINPSDEPRDGLYYIVCTPMDPEEIDITVVDRDDASASWVHAKSLPRGQPLYSGKGTGDMVQFSCPRDNPSSSDKRTWWAEGPESFGPIVSADWNIFEGGGGPPGSPTDLRWKPGTYKISCLLERVGKDDVTFERTVDVGFRTDEFVIIGQIVPTSAHSVSAVRQQTIKLILIADVVPLSVVYLLLIRVAPIATNLALSIAPAELVVGLWAGWYAIRPRTAPGDILTGVDDEEKAWMVQAGLNIAPDRPSQRLPNDGPVVMDDRRLTELADSNEYRIYQRFQAKGLIGEDGTIQESKPTVASEWRPGPTKYPRIERGQLLDITVLGIHFRSWGTPNWSEPSELPPRGHNGMKWSASGNSIAYYATGRIGEKGRKVQWHLNGRDAPWIYSEIQFNSRGAGEFPDWKIYTSMDKTVISGVDAAPPTETGDHQFNNLSVLRRNVTLDGKPFQRIKIMRMQGHVRPFIESGSTVWPGLPRPARTQ